MLNYTILLNLPATITHYNAIILSYLRSALHNIEDFGIIPIESQAAGVPVIARGSGGALETIVEGSTGLFFHKDSITELCTAIERFESQSWSAEACKSNASSFSAEKFTENFSAVSG